MKKFLMFALVPLIMLAGCKKDDDDNDQNQNNNQQQYDDYYPLATGNFWIYETEELDENGSPTGNTGQDCVVVVLDSLMKGKVYYKIQTYSLSNGSYSLIPGWIFYHDSLDCLIDQDGLVHFSYENINDTIAKQIELLPNGADTMFAVYVIMQEFAQLITVPAGTFSVLDARHHTYSDYFPQSVSQPVISSYLYAKDVGLVMFDTDWTSGTKQRNRLKDYELISE